MIVPPPNCWCPHCAAGKLVRMIMSVVSLAAARQMGQHEGEDRVWMKYWGSGFGG